MQIIHYMMSELLVLEVRLLTLSSKVEYGIHEMYILISCQLKMLMPMIPTHDFIFTDLIKIPSQRPVFL
jgi:hypothetical protein